MKPISLAWALALFAAFATASHNPPLVMTQCTGYANNLCAEVNDAEVTLYIADKTGPYFQMTIKVKEVWLSNPNLPSIFHWVNCVVIGTNNTEVFNETIINCDAVGFIGTTLTYSMKAYMQNTSLFSANEPFVIPPGAFELSYTFQYSAACNIYDTFPCETEQVNATFEYTWDVPSSMQQLWSMGINNIPSSGVLTPLTSRSHNAFGFNMDGVFRAATQFPRAVTLCPDANCATETVYDASVQAVYSQVKRLGFSVGNLGVWANVPTVVDVKYMWVGLTPSMSVDPIIYMDGLGQVFNGNLDIKNVVLISIGCFVFAIIASIVLCCCFCKCCPLYRWRVTRTKGRVYVGGAPLGETNYNMGQVVYTRAGEA